MQLVSILAIAIVSYRLVYELTVVKRQRDVGVIKEEFAVSQYSVGRQNTYGNVSKLKCKYVYDSKMTKNQLQLCTIEYWFIGVQLNPEIF